MQLLKLCGKLHPTVRRAIRNWWALGPREGMTQGQQ